MIHEDAGQLVPHRFRDEGRRHGGIHAAGQGQQYLAVAHFLPDLIDGVAHEIAHGPVALHMADLIQEVPDHVPAVFGVVHFRMVLDAVEPAALVADGHVGACCGVGHQLKALRHLLHVIPMAHPADAPGGQSPEETAVGIIEGLGLAVFPGGVVLCGSDPSPQAVCHELTSVADAEDGHTHGEDLRRDLRRTLLIDAVGSAGEDDPHGIECADLLHGGLIGFHFAVHMALPDTAGDQLIILSPEIQDQNLLILHCCVLSFYK